MTDYISRADAIGAVHEYYQKRFTEDSKWDADAKMFVLEDKTIAKDNMEICNIIKALPSADAVSREAHYDAIANRITDMEERGFVSVVRCKDCIHYEKHDTWSACTYWSGNPYEQASVIDDDFCSYGERAEQTEYQLPGHDEVMEALDKLTLRGDKDE